MMNPESNMQDNGAEKNGRVSHKNLIVLILVIALAVCVCAAAIIAVVNTIRNDNPTESTLNSEALAEQARNTVAMTVGNHNISATELNYYYVETINKFCSDYYYYIYYYGMIDTAKPLNEQYFDKEAGTTWADYFLGIAEETIKSTYVLCDMAAAEGFTLSEEQLASLDTLADSIEEYAAYYKFENVNDYIVDIFGHGADLESYLAYSERALLADAYYAHYAESLEFSDEQLREYESDKAHEYNSYCYAVYFLDAKKFRTGGTEDDKGNITYTDEQIAAAVKAAEEAANALIGSTCEDLEAFKSLILGMDINSNLDSVSVTEKKNVAYASIDKTFQEWIIASDRAFGDVTAIAKTTTTGEGEDAETVVDGYYIVWFGGVNDNKAMMKNVRHILVLFKNDAGKTYSDGITSFTDAQKATALAAAEALLEQWKSGAATEDSFASLATEKTEDGGSKNTGGLYENIYPGQMVESFEAWCYDESRQYGDTGIVESVYGYHIMYFVGESEMTYRDFMISSVMTSEALTEWHDALLEAIDIEVLCLDFCPMDKTLGG